MHRATVNNRTREVVMKEDGLAVDGKSLQWDLVEISEGYFHIIHEKKSYKAEVVKADKETKTFSLKVNGKIYVVALKDKFDLLLEKMGMSSGAGAKVNTIKAPMPGLIIDLKVKEGDTVAAGDALLILEAMKMENVIKSPGSGTIKSLRVKKGDSVEKGQTLIQF